MSKTALLIVDVQNDFCEGGALAVSGGTRVAEGIRNYLDHVTPDVVVASRDWHDPGSDNGGHISDTPDFATTWPSHCIADTVGAEYHPVIPVDRIDLHVKKGMGQPAYSAFDGITVGHSGHEASLADALRINGITRIEVVGLAKDYCVKATALDAARLGFDVVVTNTLTSSVHPEGDAAVDEALDSAGVGIRVIPSCDQDDWAVLTFAQRIQRVADEITLPPDMVLLTRKDRESPEGRWYFQVGALRRDSFTRRLEMGYGGKAYLSQHATRSELVQCVFGLTLAYVEHEAREGFQWRGRRVFGPHVDVLAHWDAAKRIDARQFNKTSTTKGA